MRRDEPVKRDDDGAGSGLAVSGVPDHSSAWQALRMCAVIALLVIAVAMSLAVSRLRAEVAERDARLWTADANSLLLEQQIDRVFESQSQRWRSGVPLGANDLALLQVWLTFDSSFATRNGPDNSLQCEVAMAHQRAGLCALLLGDCPQSIEHAQASIRLYEELARRHPSTPDYNADVAATKMLLGEALQEKGELHEALRAYDEAIALLGAPGFPRTEDDDRRLSEWRARLAALTVMESSGR